MFQYTGQEVFHHFTDTVVLCCTPHKSAIKHITTNHLPQWDLGSVDLFAGQEPQLSIIASIEELTD